MGQKSGALHMHTVVPEIITARNLYAQGVGVDPCLLIIYGVSLSWIQKALKPFSVERPKSRSGVCSGRFSSDSGAPSGRISDFWPVTPIFAL